jgi:hypothetical protein
MSVCSLGLGSHFGFVVKVHCSFTTETRSNNIRNVRVCVLCVEFAFRPYSTTTHEFAFWLSSTELLETSVIK